MAKWNCLLRANRSAIWSTSEVFLFLSTGMPPMALNRKPNGKKNHSFFIMKLTFRPNEL